MNGTVVHAIQGDTVDALVWRHYGRTAGLVEMVLNANPGLSAHGPVLPIGSEVLVAIVICALGVEAAVNRHTTTLPLLVSLSMLGFLGSVAVATPV